MLGDAAKELGFECRFVDPSESPPAASSGDVIRKPFDDPEALAGLAADCDVVTYEFENVPVAALRAIASAVPVYPPPAALAIAQDRLHEKRLFDELDIPLPGYRAIDSLHDLQQTASDLGLPIVVKTRRFGYDGKGQTVIRDLQQINEAWDELGSQPLIAEAWVPFDHEVSVIGVRNTLGDVAIWPLTQNEHVDGILCRSRAPVDNPALFERASAYMQRMLAHLDYVGVLALELFVVDDELLANEFAPRVHNSGHWTIEGAATSQFTNHLLAITGQAPGSTACSAHVGMVNLIGKIPDTAGKFGDSRISLHDYGKTPRPGRKLGHITIVAESAAERDELLRQVSEIVT
jgi:5-(carboxyamino)imidazole ribonucleotide synthase